MEEQMKAKDEQLAKELQKGKQGFSRCWVWRLPQWASSWAETW